MVVVFQCPNLAEKELSVFRTTDPSLSHDPIVVLYGPSTTLTANGGNNSRIQCHVYTPAGFQSYPRLAVSPNSPLYEAVECLPREEQGDVVCRGLAFGMLKYFSELSETAKDFWIRSSSSSKATIPELHLFDASHAASLASRMSQIVDAKSILNRLDAALSDHVVSVIDVDVVLPSGAIRKPGEQQALLKKNGAAKDDAVNRYDVKYASIIKLMGKLTGPTSCETGEQESCTTGELHGSSFTKARKEKLRLEMCELVETEENYVQKIHELLEITEDAGRTAIYAETGRAVVNRQFAACLKSISGANEKFLESVRLVLDTTENAAIEDIESTPALDNGPEQDFCGNIPDVTGVFSFAEVMVKSVSQFTGCYENYIRLYPEFCQHFKSIHGGGNTPGKTPIEAADQRLMSLLIEPIQRLPRYSLYIDNIVKQLPLCHPALPNLSAVKQQIAAACLQDANALEHSRFARLKEIIAFWPSELKLNCRFCIAADVDIIEPPYYELDEQSSKPKHCLLILLSGYLLVVRAGAGNVASARLLTAELNTITHLAGPTMKGSELQNWNLAVLESIRLSDVDFIETNAGSRIKISPSGFSNKQNRGSYSQSHLLGTDRVRVFQFRGDFKGKAVQWVSEAVKARIDGRFSLLTDASLAFPWELRHHSNHDGGLGLLSTIFEERAGHQDFSSHSYGPIRILLDSGLPSHAHRLGKDGLEILGTVSDEGNGFYRLNVEAAKERATRDLVTSAELIPVLARRIGTLLQMRHQTRNPRAAQCLISHNRSILKSLKLEDHQAKGHAEKLGKNRPTSPVKVLSHLFAGVSFKDTAAAKKPLPSLPVLSEAPFILTSTNAVKSTSEPDLTKHPVRTLSKVLLSDGGPENTQLNHIQALENSFASYILALHARKGNVVGKVLANRAFADDVAVKDLYEALLRSPDGHERAAQSSVDVLFVAFERFVKVPWRETMGPIIDHRILNEMQLKLEMLSSVEHEEYLSQTISDLAPQNQRAFKAVVGLLTDLLEGMVNDGDRGSLTAAVVEILVCDDNPHNFIPLFDRLVADCDIITNPNQRSEGATPTRVLMTTTLDRTAAGSDSYKSSSFSKRFGFGSVHRQNSKTESSAMGSVSRLWGKGSRPADVSIRELVSPTKAGSFDRRAKALKIPQVNERPTILDAFTEWEKQPEPTTPSLGQIDLGSPFSNNLINTSPEPTKKKRRSSLSDLRPTKTVNSPTLWRTPGPQVADNAPQLPQPLQASPFTPSFSFLPTSSTPTPPRSTSVRHDSPNQKENTSPVKLRYQTLRERPFSYRGENAGDYRRRLQSTPNTEELTTPEHSRSRRSPSLIPIPRAILSERSTSGNLMASPKESPIKSQTPQTLPISRKPRLQSPQKLTERIQAQRLAIWETDKTIRGEIEHVEKDVGRIIHDSKTSQSIKESQERRDQALLISNFSTRLKALDSKVSYLIAGLQNQTTTLEGQVSEVLAVTEKKIKVLDSKLRQSNEENVALYARNNEELMRVFDQVKAGHVVEELRAKLRESMREAEMWKRECRGLNRKAAVVVAVESSNAGVVRAGERLREVTRTVV